MNWHVLYDYLDRTPFLEEIQLTNPFKMSIISKTNNKNDKVDAQKIAELLHMGYIPRAHAFSQESRKIKDVVRMRGQLVKKLVGGQMVCKKQEYTKKLQTASFGGIPTSNYVPDPLLLYWCGLPQELFSSPRVNARRNSVLEGENNA